jgi:mRNA-degrading endonuclease toxin of MazEF toxin-antitoxin module
MRVTQGEIIEVSFNLPQGYLPHPAVVLSNTEIIEYEESFVAVMLSSKDYDDEYSFFITEDMLSQKPKIKYQARCHLISLFKEKDVLSKHGKLKKEHLKKLIQFIHQTTFKVD